MSVTIKSLWEKLLVTAESSVNPREWRALGRSAKGVRASIIPAGLVRELLIEVPPTWQESAEDLPQWRGMGFEIIPLSLGPRHENHQLVLSLRDDEQESVFLAYCADLVSNLENITAPQERVLKIKDSIARWGRFFEKCGEDGLGVPKQAGLFGELLWLEKMIDSGLVIERVIDSWKGCKRSFHDFDFGGKVVEVKTSMKKEPLEIFINNERQLDERGLMSMHLFFAALRVADGGGQTLVDKVQQIRDKIEVSHSTLLKFDDCLIDAGYLDAHAQQYNSHFIPREEVLFEVKDDFPRIISPPEGIGRLTYGVLISSCRSFDTNISEYLDSLGAD